MTETAATTGTSAGSAERKPADDSALTEDAKHPDGSSGEASSEEATDNQASGDGASGSTASGSGTPGSEAAAADAPAAGDGPPTGDAAASGDAAAGEDTAARADLAAGEELAVGGDTAAGEDTANLQGGVGTDGTPGGDATARADDLTDDLTQPTGPSFAAGAPADPYASSASERAGASPGTAGTDDPGTSPYGLPNPNGAVGDGASRARPSFTRPPGMVPPPDQLEEADTQPSWEGGTAGGAAPWSTGKSPSGGYPTLNASAPVSAPPRVTGRTAAGGVAVRPLGPELGDSSTAGPAPGAEAIRPRSAATPRGPRRARLNLKRVDPWSVMKFSFAVSLVLFIVVIVAASVLYLALDAMGVFTSINNTVAELIQSGAGEGSDGFQITAQGVIGTAAVLGALNVLLFTSLATLGAFIYNVCADLVGGVEVTLAERD